MIKVASNASVPVLVRTAVSWALSESEDDVPASLAQSESCGENSLGLSRVTKVVFQPSFSRALAKSSFPFFIDHSGVTKPITYGASRVGEGGNLVDVALRVRLCFGVVSRLYVDSSRESPKESFTPTKKQVGSVRHTISVDHLRRRPSGGVGFCITDSCLESNIETIA